MGEGVVFCHHVQTGFGATHSVPLWRARDVSSSLSTVVIEKRWSSTTTTPLYPEGKLAGYKYKAVVRVPVESFHPVVLYSPLSSLLCVKYRVASR
jgi:hypothetical protein